jgi:Fe-S cluster assembly protein SufD
MPLAWLLLSQEGFLFAARCPPQGAQSRGRGGPFATLNGATARDAVVVHIPAGTALPAPIHVLYLASGGGGAAAAPPAAAPRLLVVLEEGASAELVEEFVGPEGSSAAAPANGTAAAAAAAPAYLTNAVTEIELDDGAALSHGYVQLEGAGAAHWKATLVNQGRGSTYRLTEACVGGGLTRHDLSIEQLGEATQSQVRTQPRVCFTRAVHAVHVLGLTGWSGQAGAGWLGACMRV